MSARHAWLGLFAATLLGALSTPAAAITRDQVIVRAQAFSYHPWTSTSANLTGSCSSSYQSIYAPGDYMGLPYDWGGYMTLFEFDQQINAGYGAGSYPEHGVLSCTAGLDCSGFVSKAWDTGHYATSTLHQTSSEISLQQMLPGDVFNEAGYHVALYSHTLSSGEPVLYESVFYNVHFSMPGWSWVDGYVPRRFSGITGTGASNPAGTATNPIAISSFPFTANGNTSQSSSDVLDGCMLAPAANESGPEVIYQVTISQPGTLSVAVQDDAGVDIDVHLYTSTNSNDCLARHDSAFNFQVDCGTYFVVADTYKTFAGAYSLNVDFTPSGQSCGGGNGGYDFEGALGSPCAYPGDQSLPFCNPNLGTDSCIYTNSSSFCSKACATNDDCAALNGCCGDLGNGEFYCLTADLCDGGGSEPGKDDPPDPAGDPASGGAAGSGSSSAGSGGDGMGGGGLGPSATNDDAEDASAGCSVTMDRRGSPDSLLGLATLLLGALLRRRRRR